MPNKHKLKINGKPIIVYAIEAALQSKVFTDVIVTSDDEEVLEIAYDAGARLHLRNKELCTDKIQLKQVMRALSQFVNIGRDCVGLMQPDNPFVTADDLKAAYKIFKERNANYVMSVARSPIIPERIFRLRGGFIPPKIGLKRTQEYKTAYHADGSFILAKPMAFAVEYDFGFYGTKNVPYIIEHPSVDIDTEENYLYARWLMEYN